MKETIAENLNAIKGLIGEKKFSEALIEIENIEISQSNNAEYAYYCLIYADIKLWLGDYNSIIPYLNTALNYYKTSADNQYYAQAKYLQGKYLVFIGQRINAQEKLLEAYLNFKRYEDLESAQRVLNYLAFVQHQGGAINDAILNIRKCIEINQNLGKLDNVLTLKRNLALVQLTCGQIQSALMQQKEIGREIANARINDRGQYYLILSLVLGHLGDINSAREKMAMALPCLDDYQREHAIYYEYLGWIYNLDGQYDKAEKALKSGLEVALKIAPEGDLVSQIKRLLADAYLGLKQYDNAYSTAEEALKVAEKINERAEIAACYRVFAQVEQQRRISNKAREWYKKAVDLFKLIQSRYELAATQYLMAESNLYGPQERTALLYMAKEYFEAEDIKPYINKIKTLESAQHKNPKTVPLKANTDGQQAVPRFIAVHPATKKIVDMADHIAGCNMTVLLTGPTGSGKDHLAAYIHEQSGRTGEFVTINCAAIPDSMVEAELFGYAKGAFTGADGEKTGLLEHADGGTVYLNEIGDGTEALQAKLLEVIETRRIRRLGSTESRQVDIRFIAATCHDLKERIQNGKFRLDLYHRLNEIPIFLPPLDERKDDIPELVRHYLSSMDASIKAGNGDLEYARLCELLVDRTWAGNIRELRLKLNWLHKMFGSDISGMVDHLEAQELSDRELLLKTLEETGWNRSETARRLGVTEGTVRYRIAKYNLVERVT